jgi:hypothetical protein
MSELFESASQAGVELARRVIAESEAARAETLALRRPFAGHLILEGDSWFDYPFFKDIAACLRKDFGYRVRSAARYGHTAELMAYVPRQLEEVHDLFRDLSDERQKARAILLSCGGNDFVDVFSAALNHKHPNVSQLNATVLAGVLKQELPRTLVHLVGSLVTFSERYFGERRPILIHGYGDPVPDGRDYPIFGLSGPWLEPVFIRKGYVSDSPQSGAELAANSRVLAELIRYFNEETLPLVKDEVARRFGDLLVIVDVRPAFSNEVASGRYQLDWRDEMHGTAAAFRRAAAIIDAEIRRIPMP